ncbi:MAG TPA: MFS transporter [Candidatus Krumholzibacteria bacterium]|nr:MFS transporter [Candidatus Krumholzibacteria bacterium]HPD72591.1 MFS transporter [Candidatus Krumholzibacteria bacterium]HRY40477.1 MFS transporter [Candidatus Krumholzibacteria bacterium]
MSAQQRLDIRRMLLASVAFGATAGIFNTALGNYLHDVHAFGASARGWLEFPRELPGFLVVFTAGFLAVRYRESRTMAVAMLVTMTGAVGLALFAPTAWLAVVWIFVWSAGDHMNFALEGPLGLKLAKQGGEGRRLGQFGGAKNLGGLLGAGAVYLIARALGDDYRVFFLVAAAFVVVAAWNFFRMETGRRDQAPRHFVWRREYGVFYAISALFGIRKQIFYVFGTWVLVDIHHVRVSTIATLMFLGAGLGVVARPLLGDVIDWIGERLVLSLDEAILALICLVYAFADRVFAPGAALWALYTAYVLDQTLFALRIARTTYLKKIAVDPADITPTMSLGVTIDHAVAMSLPIFSGWLWVHVGYAWVFVTAAAIALAGLGVCLRIRIPSPAPAAAGAPRPATPSA